MRCRAARTVSIVSRMFGASLKQATNRVISSASTMGEDVSRSEAAQVSEAGGEEDILSLDRAGAAPQGVRPPSFGPRGKRHHLSQLAALFARRLDGQGLPF